MKEWEAVIGLEVHAQLNTKTKLFCSCPNRFGDSPNQNTCEICLAHPGVLPTPNQKSIEKAIQLGLATKSHIHLLSYFERKNYFYPDNPKAYQISQLKKPICEGGKITIKINDKKNSYTKDIHLERIQIEEDAGKLIHLDSESNNAQGLKKSYVDLNRAGTPLLEIVSKAEMNSSLEAIEYFKTLRNLLLYLEINDGNMQEGSLRADVNLSLREKNSRTLGIRTETKNLNSFKSIEQAIEYEITRQSQLLNENQAVVQETLLFDKKRLVTKPMRSKEEAQDYRYFSEPDLMPIKIKPSLIEELKDNLVELPQEKFNRFLKEYQLSNYDTWVLTSDKFLADYFERAVKAYPEGTKRAKKICNWINTEILSIVNFQQITINEFNLDSLHLATLIKLMDEGTISGKIAKTIFPEMVAKNASPETILKEKNLKLVSNEEEITAVVKSVIEANPEAFEKYQRGNQKIAGFFVGQIMKATKGQANPQKVNEILKKMLDS